MTTELESKIKAELDAAKIEEFDIISVEKQWWIQIYFLEEESMDYLSKTLKILDDICFGTLRNHDCKISIQEDKNVFYLLAKFSPRTYGYSYNQPIYNYPTTSSSKNSPSSPLWGGAPSYPSTGGFIEEEEGDIEDTPSQSSKFIVSKQKKQEIFNASKLLPMVENELSHITRIISDRMYSEETPSLRGPSKLPAQQNSYYWTTPSKTITITKISSPINPTTRNVITDIYPGTVFYTCYLVDVLHKTTKKEVSYFLSTFSDLRKMEFY